MAKTSLKVKAPANRPALRAYTRCNRCGRPLGVHKFGLCRVCLRELALWRTPRCHQGSW